MRRKLQKCCYLLQVLFVFFFFYHLLSLKNSDKMRSKYDSDRYIRSFAHMYPDTGDSSSDRIVDQLGFATKDVVKRHVHEEDIGITPRRILVYDGLSEWRLPKGRKIFDEEECTVRDCELTDDRLQMSEVDVVIFRGVPPESEDEKRSPRQIWALYLQEPPYRTPSFEKRPSVFNWTATYRHDSTIVIPYEKYLPFSPLQPTRTPTKNYAEGKKKLVFWYGSNCKAHNNRIEYIEELAKYIQVDTYGDCGKLKCPQTHGCVKALTDDYKFLLAFEDSNCRDFITRIFFLRGLENDIVPIVMGAAPEDYERTAPPHSYIHVDDFQSPKELADYLVKLDKNDTLYNEYFSWKGLWQNIITFFWCRVCVLAHDTLGRGRSWYADVEKWWRGPGVCIGNQSWRNVLRSQQRIGEPAIRYDL